LTTSLYHLKEKDLRLESIHINNSTAAK